MKLYRVQAKYKNIYIDEMLEAENDKAVLEDFKNKVASGDVTEKEGAGFLNPDILFITFEEVDRDATKVNIGETSVGVQMGNTSVAAGKSNP
jgi:phosphopantothenate synthetase